MWKRTNFQTVWSIKGEVSLLFVFRHSNSGRISHFDIRNPTLTFKFGPIIAFWHDSKSYFEIQTGVEYRILPFEILFCHSNSGSLSHFDIRNPILKFKLGPNIAFCHSKSCFAIRIRAAYRILTFEILFWNSNWDRISHFNIRNPILTFEFGPHIAFWHSKSYFDIRIRAAYRIFTFEILFWHSNVAEYRILIFEILFWHSNWAEYRILSIKILLWHSNWGGIANLRIQNPTFTFEFRANIAF